MLPGHSTARHRRPTPPSRSAKGKQLAEQGTGGVNLRAIAREMGTASSALYRYFASSGELIGALCADAYHAVAGAVADARDAVPEQDHARRWIAVCDGCRAWSLEHPADFALIFGTPVPGYRASGEVTGPGAARLLAIALETYTAAVQAGAADPARTQLPPDLTAGPLLEDLLGRGGDSGTSGLAAIVLSGWASILGYLTAEIFGSLRELTADPARMYQAHIRSIMLGMGYHLEFIPDAA